MASLFTRRLVAAIPILLVISAICFTLLHAVPGGPEAALAENPKVSPEDLARIRSNFGLDDPVWQQYFRWLARSVRGDFGYSYVTGEPVAAMILARLPATLELMVAAVLIALVAGVGGGVLLAIRAHTRLDVFVGLLALVALSIPVFWSGLMAILIFSVKFGMFPTSGMATIGVPFSVGDHIRHLILPALVLALGFVASWSRYTRASVLDIMAHNFVSVARAKGLSEATILLRHALRNAAAPVLTVVAMNVPALLTGAIITETVFAWPGMGRLFYDGLMRMDYSRVMGVLLVSSVLIVIFNLLADWMYGLLDPRIGRAGREEAGVARIR